MQINTEKLTGRDLANYLKVHSGDFDGNGDELCMAAGYGIETEDGSLKCNFKAFVQALSQAVEMQDDFQGSV